MENEFKLNDIAAELFIVHQATIDKIYAQENPIELMGLYSFYYKTAKWQKTNTIKATNTYVKQSLNIGNDKIKQLKDVLVSLGLIKPIQRRVKGVIQGWYLEVCYIVSDEKKNTFLHPDSSRVSPESGLTTCGSQETNALKESSYMLKDNQSKKTKAKKFEKEFDIFYDLYQLKKSKQTAKNSFEKILSKSKEPTITFENIIKGLKKYNQEIKFKNTAKEYIKHPSSWLNQECWVDDYITGTTPCKTQTWTPNIKEDCLFDNEKHIEKYDKIIKKIESYTNQKIDQSVYNDVIQTIKSWDLVAYSQSLRDSTLPEINQWFNAKTKSNDYVTKTFVKYMEFLENDKSWADKNMSYFKTNSKFFQEFTQNIYYKNMTNIQVYLHQKYLEEGNPFVNTKCISEFKDSFTKNIKMILPNNWEDRFSNVDYGRLYTTEEGYKRCIMR